MRIATQQRIALVLSLGIALLACVMFIASTRHIESLTQGNDTDRRIVEALSNMRFLVTQYITYGEDRFKSRWLAEDARLHQSLQESGYTAQSQALRNTIQLNHEYVRRAFRQLTDVRAKFAAGGLQQTQLDDLQDRLTSVLLAKSQDMLADALHLTRIGYERLNATGKIASLGTLIFLMIVIGAVVANAHHVARGVLRPLGKIQDGAARVGGGDLHYRIGIDTADEIGDLARAFNAMTLHLHQARAGQILAEESLRAHANLLEGMFNKMHDGVSVVGANLGIVRANPTARRFMGLQPDDPLPARWQDIKGRFRPDRVTLIKPEELYLTRMLHGEPVSGTEFFIVNDNYPQGRCLESIGTMIEGDATTGVALVIWHDVTVAKQTEEERGSSRLARAVQGRTRHDDGQGRRRGPAGGDGCAASRHHGHAAHSHAGRATQCRTRGPAATARHLVRGDFPVVTVEMRCADKENNK